MPANPLSRPTQPTDDVKNEPIVRVVEKEHTSNSLTPYWVPWALGLLLMSAVVITVGITEMAAPIAGILFALGLAVATIGVSRQAFRSLRLRSKDESATKNGSVVVRHDEEHVTTNVVPLSTRRSDAVKSAAQGGSRS